MRTCDAPMQPTAPAQGPNRWRPWIRRWRPWILGAAVAAAAVAFALTHMPSPNPAPTALPTPSPGVFPGEQSMTGDDLLLTMADRIAGTPADTRTGTYELMHSTIWNPQIQGPIYAVDQKTWHLPDGTARYAIQRSRTLPADGFDPMTASLDFTTTDVEQTIQDSTIDPDLVDSPDIILTPGGDATAQLDWYLNTQRRGQPATSRVRIQELVTLYHQQIVPPSLRAAILRLLADLPDITFAHQHTTDPLHRDSIAFTASSHDSQITLIIDPVTGTLNAVHERFKGRLFAYTLFHPSQWADQRGPTHLLPTPISTIPPSHSGETRVVGVNASGSAA